MQCMRPSLKLALLLALLCSNNSFAAEAVDPQDINSWNPDDTGQNVNWSIPVQDQYLSIKPSANIWGFIGKRGVAKAQGMWPFGGDGLQSVFYGLVEGAGSYDSKTGYSAGIGVGYRKIFNGSYLLGGYIIPDWNRSPYKHHFWTINPGFEALNEVWDFRVNGYFPLGGKSWQDDAVWADDIGNYNYLHFQGHQQYNHMFATREETAAGIDGEVGRRIPIKHLEGLKLFVGGYYFGMDKTENISGIEGRLFYPLSKHTAFEVRDSYDRVRKNICQVGIRINFGGFDNNEKDSLGVVTRLTDPIEHNFANFASGNTVPVNTAFIDKGDNELEKANVWFFQSSNAISGDGTYEHPYSGIDPTVVNHIAADPQGVDASLYFGPGNYSLAGFPNSRMVLAPGFSVWGRSAGYVYPAYLSGNLPVFRGGVDLSVGNNALDSVSILNDGAQDLGVYVTSAGNALSHVNVGTDGSTPGAYQTGVLVDSGGVLDLVQNNQIYGFTANPDFACGVEVYRNGTLTVGNNNKINALTTSADAWVYGLNVGYSNVLVYGNNNFFGGSVLGTTPGQGKAFGAVMADSDVTINGNNNTFLGTTSGGAGYGIQMQNFGSGTTTLNINGNNNGFIGTSGKTSNDNQAYGIWFTDSTVNINGSGNSIIGAAAHADAIGILANNSSSILNFGASSSQNSIQGLTDDADKAVGILNHGSLIINGNNNIIIARNHTGSSATGIYNQGDVKINGNNNQITATTSGNTGAYGINNLAGASVLLAGSNNAIQATSSASTAYGIYVNSGSTLTISGTGNAIVGQNTGGIANAYGIENEGTVDITATGNNNSIRGISAAGNGTGLLDGSGATLTIAGTGNTFYGESQAAGKGIGLDYQAGPGTFNFANNRAIGVSSAGNGIGLALANGATANIGNNAVISGTSNSGTAYGIHVDGATGGNVIVSGTGATISATSAANFAYGIYDTKAGTSVTITGSGNTIAATSTTGSAYAAYLYGGTLNVSGNNNNFTATSTSGSAYGIFANSEAVTIAGSGNSINVNSISAGNIYGIYAESSSTVLHITGVNFNLGQASGAAPGSAYGIYADGTKQANMTISGNTFTVSAPTANNSYGIYGKTGSGIDWDNDFKTRLRTENTFAGTIPDEGHEVFPPNTTKN